MISLFSDLWVCESLLASRAFETSKDEWSVIFCVVMLVTQSCWLFVIHELYSPPGSSVHGILQAGILEWVAIPFSKGIFLIQGLNHGLLHCRQILYHLSHQGNLSYFLELPKLDFVQCFLVIGAKRHPFFKFTPSIFVLLIEKCSWHFCTMISWMLFLWMRPWYVFKGKNESTLRETSK